MSRHRSTSSPSSRSARLLAAPAAGALLVGFVSVLVPPTAFAADKDCPDFASQADAQAYFEAQGGSATNNVDRLDANGNGVACENQAYAPTTDVVPPAPSDAPTGGVEAGDGSGSGLFRLF